MNYNLCRLNYNPPLAEYILENSDAMTRPGTGG